MMVRSDDTKSKVLTLLSYTTAILGSVGVMVLRYPRLCTGRVIQMRPVESAVMAPLAPFSLVELVQSSGRGRLLLPLL